MSANVQPEAQVSVRRRGAWKRRVAFAVYVVGAFWSLAALQAAGATMIERDWGMLPAWSIIAISGWWITAGIGIRLGVVPREFLHAVGAALGFAREPKERDRD